MLAVSALTLSFATPSPRTLASFDDDWRFHRGDAAGASDPKFDDGAWRTLDVPHDWSSEDLPPRADDVLTVRNGTWKFHRGDDAQWSSPAFDDAAWERVRVPMPEIVPLNREDDGHLTIDVRDAKEAEAKGKGPDELTEHEFELAGMSRQQGNVAGFVADF